MIIRSVEVTSTEKPYLLSVRNFIWMILKLAGSTAGVFKDICMLCRGTTVRIQSGPRTTFQGPSAASICGCSLEREATDWATRGLLGHQARQTEQRTQGRLHDARKARGLPSIYSLVRKKKLDWAGFEFGSTFSVKLEKGFHDASADSAL